MKGKRFRKRLKRFKKVRKYELQDKAFQFLGIFCTLFGIVVLGALLVDVLMSGLKRLDWNFIMDLPSRTASRAGVYTAWIGTLWIMILTAVIALPLGIGAGLYLEEYGKKNRVANFIEINIANLAGVPSIIYGLLGLELFARVMMLGDSILTGALTLALLILPIIIVSTREALKAVPYSIREASYGIGATKWQTIWYQVLPASMSGIITGAILAISRAIGETAPLVLIGSLSYISFAPNSPMDPFSVLPVQIFNWISRPQPEFAENAAAAIILLLSITFLMNGVAVYFRYKAQKKIKW